MDQSTTAGFSADTEILTHAGWKLFPKLSDDDEVATRSPAGMFQWQRPVAIRSQPHDGQMVEFVSKSIDLMVRPGHPMLVRRPAYWVERHPSCEGQDWHTRPASWFAEHPTAWWVFPATSRWLGLAPSEFVLEGWEADRRHPAWNRATEWLAAQLTGEWTHSGDLDGARKAAGISDQAYRAARANLGVKSRRIGWGNGSHCETGRPTRQYVPAAGPYTPMRELRIPMDAFCAFLGLFLAEGWVAAHRNDVIVSQSPESRHLPEVRAILAATGLNWGYDAKNWKFSVSHKTLAPWMKENCGHRAWNKRVPSGFKDYPASFLNLILRGGIIGDGHWGPVEQRRYTTTSPQLADDVQEMYQKTGADTWISRQDLRGYENGAYGNHNHVTLVVRERMQDTHMLPRAAMAGYHGDAWSVTVPNDVIYVRRGGRAVWCAA